MSTPDEHLKAQWDEVHRIEEDLKTLERLGVLRTDPAWERLYRARGAALSKVGKNVSRNTILLAFSFGFSPGSIKLWHDAEGGWMSEALERPGATPVFHKVSDEIAAAIIKKEVTKELEHYLMTPDDYEGE